MPILRNIKNIKRFIITILAPVGVPHIYEQNIPIKKHTIDITAEDIITDLKLLNTLIDDNAGNIIRLDINNEPINLMPITMVIAVSTAIKKL